MNDVDSIAEQVLPLDGPYDHDSVANAAALLAELVRHLNHATLLHKAPVPATTVYRVVGSLRGAAGGLEQLLRQLGGQLTRAADDPTLTRAGYGPTTQTAAELALGAAYALQAASAKVAGVGAELAGAASATSHLYHDEERV